MRDQLTIVVPVYRSADCIEILVARGNAALEASAISAQWLFVDDNSPDDAWEVVTALCVRIGNVAALRLKRNVGQHGAIYVGLAQVTSPWAAVMDCDLQDPPEELIRLFEVARSGSDIVLAAVQQNATTRFRRLGSHLYRGLVGVRSPDQLVLTTLSVISARARSAYLASRFAGSAYLLVLMRTGLPMKFVQSYRDNRLTGRSSYSVFKLVTVAGRNVLLFQPWILLGVAGTFWLVTGVLCALLLPTPFTLIGLAGFVASMVTLGVARLISISRANAMRNVTFLVASCASSQAKMNA